jgi:hypothetical protein
VYRCRGDGSWGPCGCGGGAAGSAAAGGAPAADAGGAVTAGASGAPVAGMSGAGTGSRGGSPGGSGGAVVIPAGSGGSGACHGFPIGQSGQGGATGCVGEPYPAETVHADMYIMLDRTSSMNAQLTDSGQTRWQAVSAGIEQFVAAPQVQATGVGLGFFSHSMSDDEAVECDPSNYATPAVQIAPLSESGFDISAAISDMTQSIGGFTPTYPALQGALQLATERAASAADRAVVVVLITDGLPTQCEPQDIQSIAALAEDAYVNHGVLTYGIGVGPAMWNSDPLGAVARSGGTMTASIIYQGDGAAQLLDALLGIASAQSGCVFEVPQPAEPIDFDLLQVIFNPQSGPAEELPRLDEAGLCAQSAQGGWYYDAPASPSRIHLCGCNCRRLGDGQLELRLGCAPRTPSSG